MRAPRRYETRKKSRQLRLTHLSELMDGVRASRGEGEKSKCFINKVPCHARKSVKQKVLSSNSSLCSIGPLSNVHFPSKRVTFILFLELLLGLPGGSAGKKYACNVGDLGLIPGLGRSPGEGNSYPLQYCGLENSMDCTVRGGHKELETVSSVSQNKQFKIIFCLQRGIFGVA